MDYFRVLPPFSSALLTLSISNSLIYTFNACKSPSPSRTINKAGSTTLLAVIAWLSDSPDRRLIAALLFSAVGDAFLASSDSDSFFLYGLASFLSSHILYVRLFLSAGYGPQFILSETWRSSAAGIMVLVSLAMSFILIPRVAKSLRVPVLGYSVAITSMVLASLTLDNTNVITGAFIFTASDALLAAEKFLVSTSSIHRKWMPYAVWVLYYSGQVLLGLGLLLE